MTDVEEIDDDFRQAMADWVAIKTQLAEARKDMRVLNTREKELKKYIAEYMSSIEIDCVNLKKGKVTVKTSERAGTVTKKAVQNGLIIYFQGDEIRAEAAMNCILDNIERKQTTTVTLKQ